MRKRNANKIVRVYIVWYACRLLNDPIKHVTSLIWKYRSMSHAMRSHSKNFFAGKFPYWLLIIKREGHTLIFFILFQVKFHYKLFTESKIGILLEFKNYMSFRFFSFSFRIGLYLFSCIILICRMRLSLITSVASLSSVPMMCHFLPIRIHINP